MNDLHTIGRALLAADADVERLRQSCARNGMDDDTTVKLTRVRCRILTDPLRSQLVGDTLQSDELAYLRALQEIAFLLHDDELDGRALWREVAQRLDDVISAVDRALSADVAAGRRAA